MGLTAFYGEPTPQEDANALIAAALARGVTHFDTAEIYRSGNPFAPPTDETIYNEAVLGEALRASGAARDSYTVSFQFCLFNSLRI